MRILIISATLFIAGCQNYAPYDESSPFFSLPLNSTLTLNQAVTIPANQVGVRMQYGKITSSADIDQYHPNCRLEVHTLESVSRTIEADTFTIYRVLFDEDYSSRPVRYAAGLGFTMADGGFSPQAYATLIFLRSEKQPNITRIVCQHWEDPPVARHLSIEQMRHAMGDILTLNLNTTK